jgi:Fur family peroxide stress response transcriptional regulator
MVNKTAVRILTEKGLRVTPQRTAVLDVTLNLNNHPSAENISEYLRLNYPHVPIGTVYKILEAFVANGILSRVKTENRQIRYDPVMEKHYHLYNPDSDQIADLFDADLNKILENYFQKKIIPGFTIKDFYLQVVGNFSEEPAS